jgi:hypothetical protein
MTCHVIVDRPLVLAFYVYSWHAVNLWPFNDLSTPSDICIVFNWLKNQSNDSNWQLIEKKLQAINVSADVDTRSYGCKQSSENNSISLIF